MRLQRKYRERDELSVVNNSAISNRLARRTVALLGFAIVLFSCPLSAVTASGSFTNATRADEDYSKFSHSSDNHARQACSACHQRKDNSATHRFPGHKACLGCHSTQFLEPRVPMCNICHSNLSGSDPPLRAFPSKFKESFNAKFDHAQHDRGDARPSTGCASCHSASLRRGAAMTIPIGITAHNNCYQCHTPDNTSSWRDIGSCATCHAVAPFRRTSTTAAAFSVSFSHAEHGPKQRLNCADCHSLKEGLPQTKQVSSPRAAQHFPPASGLSCATCHNNKKAFGEKNYDDCTRCHKGATFKFRRT
jgi:c(7)-type cytochrome triheme protein